MDFSLPSEGRGQGSESLRARHFSATPEQTWALRSGAEPAESLGQTGDAITPRPPVADAIDPQDRPRMVRKRKRAVRHGSTLKPFPGAGEGARVS
jgi:hypothetical protein